jgi:hypothetical protein
MKATLQLCFVPKLAALALPTLGKLTEADTSGGSYTDVTGGAFTITTANTASVQKISVNSDNTKRFIKAVVTVAGGTGTGAVAIVGLGSKKYS